MIALSRLSHTPFLPSSSSGRHNFHPHILIVRATRRLLLGFVFFWTHERSFGEGTLYCCYSYFSIAAKNFKGSYLWSLFTVTPRKTKNLPMRLKRWMVSLIALSLPLVKLNHHWFTYFDHLLAPSSAFERPPSKSLKVKGGAMLE